jgi:hypothetical protein
MSIVVNLLLRSKVQAGVRRRIYTEVAVLVFVMCGKETANLDTEKQFNP